MNVRSQVKERLIGIYWMRGMDLLGGSMVALRLTVRFLDEAKIILRESFGLGWIRHLD